MVDSARSNAPSPPSIQVNHLSYKFQDGSSGLTDINLDLPAGSRTLLIGGKQKKYNTLKSLFNPVTKSTTLTP